LTRTDKTFLPIRLPALAKDYTAPYREVLHPNPPAIHAPKKPKVAPPKPHKAVKVGGATITLYFTTGVNEFEDAETATVKALKGAKKVRIAAMHLGDGGILTSLKQKFQNANSDIEGVLDPGQMRSVMPPPAGKSKQDPKLFWFTK